MSIYLIDRATVPIGTLFAGALADYFGGPIAVRMISASALILVLTVLRTQPSFFHLKVDLQEEPDETDRALVCDSLMDSWS